MGVDGVVRVPGEQYSHIGDGSFLSKCNQLQIIIICYNCHQGILRYSKSTL